MEPNLPDSQHMESLLDDLRQMLSKSDRCTVVLDDDPTGTQTVYNTPVLMTWDRQTLTEQLSRDDKLFYLLTNSRALTEPDAIALAETIGENLREAAATVGRPISVISRSDSTLRGHYPAEVDAIAEAMGQPDAVHVLMPFFLQGGRLTVNDTHFVAEGDRLVPAAETPFAKDATFGFSHSNLRDWVVEKRKGQFDRGRIHSLSIDDLRTQTIEAIAKSIASVPAGGVLIVNATDLSDAYTFALAAHHAEIAGANLVYRTAASFVQAYAGLAQKPLLNSEQMIASEHRAGLIVVGSYVPKTTAQLNRLLAAPNAPTPVILEAAKLLSDDRERHIGEVVQTARSLLKSGQDVVVHTSRSLITGDDAVSSLQIGTRVSEAVVRVVREIDAPLRFLIAKGGITSSDVATQALEAKRALVLGQILPGIPVWSLGEQSRRPSLPYIVFPGNVGGDDALAEAYAKLRRPD